MENPRPKIDIPSSKTDIFIKRLSILIIIAISIFTFISWYRLPQIIPTHFNALGEIDGYGSKNTVLFLLPIIILMYIGLNALGKNPSIYNYVVAITEQNARIQYIFASRLISLLKLEVLLIFTYLDIATILSAFNSELTLGFWFLPISLIIIFGTLGIYLYKSVKAK